jgi:hypothetical protein
LRQIYFFFAGVEVGPFSEEQVKRYLQEGYLSLSDSAKDDGANEWSPLQKILDGVPLPQPKSQPVPSLKALTTKVAAKPLPPAQVGKRIALAVNKNHICKISSVNPRDK